jgi:hypothetical protein
MKRIAFVGVVAVALAAQAAGAVSVPAPDSADQPARPPPPKPLLPPDLVPTRGDMAYGLHRSNQMDFWAAKGPGPKPAVLWVGGYRFREVEKRKVPPDFLRACRAAGMSVASITYRLPLEAPLPAAMLDGARAVQFLRSQAEALDLDARRVAAAGESAGGSVAIWVALHDDLADPTAEDALARQSSRVACAAVRNAQTSFDPRFYRKHNIRYPDGLEDFLALHGVTPDRENAPASLRQYEESAAVTHASKSDPPLWLHYDKPQRYMTGQLGPYHPVFGEALKALLGPLGVACTVRVGTDAPPEARDDGAAGREMVEFLRRRLGLGSGTDAASGR